MESEFVFSRESIKLLITLYEQQPGLYDLSHPQYKSKHVRQAVLQKILNEFIETYAGATLVDIQRKIRNLRTQFFNEFKKYKKSLASGVGSDMVYKSNWWCYNQLMFLASNHHRKTAVPHLEFHSEEISSHKDDSENILFENKLFEGKGEDLSTDEVYFDTSSPSSTRPSSRLSEMPHSQKRKRRANEESKTQNLLKHALAALMSSRHRTKQNHFDIFGAAVAAELRRIKDDRILNRLKRKIMNDIYDALDEISE